MSIEVFACTGRGAKDRLSCSLRRSAEDHRD